MAKDLKEGGYGWCVTTASFLVHAVIGGLAYGSGVYHVIFREHYRHPEHLRASWIGACLMGLTALGGKPQFLT